MLIVLLRVKTLEGARRVIVGIRRLSVLRKVSAHAILHHVGGMHLEVSPAGVTMVPIVVIPGERIGAHLGLDELIDAHPIPVRTARLTVRGDTAVRGLGEELDIGGRPVGEEQWAKHHGLWPLVACIVKVKLVSVDRRRAENKMMRKWS